jgi:TolB-like protein
MSTPLRPTRVVVALGVIAMWGSVLDAQCPDGSPPPCSRAASRAPAPNSVAVLYLDNLSRDTADAYLADGLTEEIIIRLGQVQRLDVKSRFEVQRFKGRAIQDATALGRSLNAAYLVTGSVQRSGDRVRLRIALVRTATRAQAWGDVIDRASSDLLSLESDIAREVTTAITGQLLPAERSRLARRLTNDPVAYEEYLRGLSELHRSFDEASARSALGHFARAIARDSGFAAAFAAEALAWASLADGHVPGREGYGHAREAADEALRRDSSQTFSYAMLAAAALAIDFDAPKAEQLSDRGLKLDPHDREGHIILSRALFAEGRLDGSLAEAQQAWQLDSLNSFYGFWHFMVLIYERRLDDAAALLARLRGILSPVDVDPMEGILRNARGDLRGAEHLLSWRYYGGRDAGTYVRALLARGDSSAARATIDSMLAVRTAGYYNPLAFARAYAALGEVDRGMQWLQRAFDERTMWLVYVRVDPELALLRADPRYAMLDRQLKY